LIFEFRAEGIFNPRVIFEYISQLAHAIDETRGDCGEDGRNQQNKGRIAAQQQAPVAS
jgi:hypothetical protein